MKIKLPVFLLGVLAVPLVFGYCSLGGGSAPDPTPPTYPIDLLPAATTTGANTWGCLRNGEAWQDGGSAVKAEWVLPNRLVASMSRFQHFDNVSYEDRIEFTLLDTTNAFAQKLGVYSINYYQRPQIVSARHFDSFYNSSEQANFGTLTITYLDRQAGIISGTFDVTFPGGRRLTNGRFDIGNMTR